MARCRRRDGTSGHDDPFGVTLEDDDLLSEVELTTNLIVGVSEFERHLSDLEIDPDTRRGRR